jgi:hypothetical protein
MSKIATMRQVCQLIVDHSQTFDSKKKQKFQNKILLLSISDLKSQITKDTDLSNIIKQFLILYIVQYVSKSRINKTISYKFFF